MKSNFTSIILSGAAAAAMLLLAGCAKENGLNPVDKSCAELELADVNSGEMLSKAAIDGTGFPRDGRIGLFFFKDEAGAELYGDSTCSNVEYSYNQDKGKWTANPAIRVGSTPGYLYGYYPYNGAYKDVKAIAVESSLDGDDVMYAAKQDPVTDQTAGNVAITMRHALARVSIIVKNKGYSGAAKLSRIEFVGAKTAPSGTLNALDGSINATKSDVALEVPEANQQITEAGTRYECFLVPSEVDAKAQNVTLRLTIDGQQKTVSLTGENAMKIVSGVKARLTLDLSDTGLSIVDGGIQIDDWQTVTVGGYTVTVKLSDDVTPHDILTDVYADGNTAKILAVSLSEKPLKCTSAGTAEVARTISGDTFTFTISNVASDVIATIGYDELLTVKAFSNNTAWGTVAFEGSPYKGETITFTASQINGKFVEWQDVEGKKLCTDNPYSVTLTSNLTVKAVFEFYGVFPGVFTVEEDIIGNPTKTVQFSKGNLYWDGSKYDFESEQYSCQANGPWEETHVSHFYWHRDAAIARCESYYIELDFGRSTSDVFFTNKDDFKVGNALTGAYKSLSKYEWVCLINQRNASNIGETANARYAKATIKVDDSKSVPGLILFPDVFAVPEGVTPPSGININKAGFDTNTYSVDDWCKFESAGAVFLPSAGCRSNANISNVGGHGYYWSSTPYDYYDVYYLYFNSGYVNPIPKPRNQACSVRLVTESKL